MKFKAIAYQIQLEGGEHLDVNLRHQNVRADVPCHGLGDPECDSHADVVHDKLKSIKLTGLDHHTELAAFLHKITSAPLSELVFTCQANQDGTFTCVCNLGSSMPIDPVIPV